MPRTRLTTKYSEPKRPPVDWLRAVVYERSAVLGYDLKRLAAVGGVSYDSMRKLNRVSPWDWPYPVREKICRELGVKPIRSVEGAPKEDEL